MKIEIINKTIRAMCAEVKVLEESLQDWQLLTEEELLYEAAICMFGSQMVFELAVAKADRLRGLGLLRFQKYGFNRKDYEASIVSAFTEPLAIYAGTGLTRWVRPRFRNRLAFLLTATVAEIHDRGVSMQQLLIAASSAKSAREALVRHVWGFGPKQASLYLRRVGYCADLAVLDIHVLDYLRLTRGLTLETSKLGCLTFYEQIENEFSKIAAEFGHSVGCVDLATWLTMRVAKREAYL